MNFLVLGGYGAVGAAVVGELRAAGHSVTTAGRDAARADRAVDLREPGLRSYREALAGIDVVVNAAGVESIDVVAATGPAAFVDITATTAYVHAVERLAPTGPVLLSVGLAPGLTNLLAAQLHRERPARRIDVAVLLGTGDAHGAAATGWTFGLLGRRFADPATGEPVLNFSGAHPFDLPGAGRRRLVRADFADQHVLTRDLGVPVRTWFGLTSRFATAGLTLLSRLPGAGSLPGDAHLPGSDAWLVCAVADDGRTRARAGRGQSLATAEIAARAAALAPTLAPGVHHLHQVAR
ncbi:NAD-dependent epimerase/dehydratase family protein [Pseudonocardia sp. TRM90224]|uniref:NAD-dependent epimerase/dehydratase family protein n=1 Tax=Pseudonocardia sp. TRM90224 TaxID=2812678 RepID=UPI001E5335E2|nr:NAD-dependent epimerase/dehydratase family protein [Pseudonocardia sp. TRM90224]